jgi:hypothetical protein
VLKNQTLTRQNLGVIQQLDKNRTERGLGGDWQRTARGVVSDAELTLGIGKNRGSRKVGKSHHPLR